MRLVLPRLYVILDAALLPAKKTEMECASDLADAGVRLVQYRNKGTSAWQLLETSRKLAAMLEPRGVSFVVNDRADVAALSGASGAHVGQDDLEAESARLIVGAEKWVGVSTHNFEQLQRAASSSADYFAVGPIFSTSSKANPDPAVGIEFLRRVRCLTERPIVAIGGISLERAREVLEAGADSVAVIRGIWGATEPYERARHYITTLEAAK